MKNTKKRGARCDEAEFEELKEARRRNDVIQKYLDKEITYKSALGLIPCSKTTFYRLLHKYDEDAGSLALLQTKRGRKKGEYQLVEAVENIIVECIKSKLINRVAGPSAVWKAVKDKCTESSLPIPSLGAVAKRVYSISPLELRKLQYGAADAYDKLGMKPGRLKLSRPLQVTQIDHTRVDIILCDDDRTPLGRPWLTVLIDVNTRVILSYYLSWHNPSSVSVAATIAFAVANKADYLSMIGCEGINYPFSGKPEAINSDNAKEFKTLSMEKACDKNKIKLNWRPPGKKHYGGHIERLIGTLMGEVHFLPGTTFSNTKVRKGYDSEKKSCMTFLEFSKWFATQVAIYHSTPHSAIKKTPGDAWFDYFGSYNPNILTNSEKAELTIDFLPQDRRTICTKGIRFKNNYYYCPDLTPHVGKDILIKYNPLSMKKIWARLNDEYINVPFSDLAQNDNLFEVARIGGLFQQEKSKARWVTEEGRIELRKTSEEIVLNAQAITRKERRQQAIRREHGPRLPVEIHSKISVDYSKKPLPFNSED
ncbi:Mu transposase C-terminal domain-containing protein [Pseudomonas nunensis]|uniref:Mu transposase C-terminal domain-containing protein n=1 Tax=Pseudomonas nunensis TaxID=2961896 RepID=UPI0025AF266E|nr:Mu transposase C-terminal domain-containing protein [Pseudomonas nunensis]MDN3219607.1 Mu transposase C-terminal domain-containing protein [Pseudomonas nunensis]